MRHFNLLLVLVSSLSVGCSSRAPNEPVSTSSQAIATSPATVIPGYQHDIQHSKFNLGAIVTERDEFGMHKLVGTDGVFATRSSGLVTALSNGDSPEQAGTPIGNNAAHNDAVKAYFISAGLPENQISLVQDFEVVGAPVTPGEHGPIHGQVAYRYSMVKRQIQGIQVPDSFAWARMNADYVVVEEQIYWPSIPQTVLDDALAFSAALQGPTGALFQAKLPIHQSQTGVVIRHSPGEWEQSFYAKRVFNRNLAQDEAFWHAGSPCPDIRIHRT